MQQGGVHATLNRHADVCRCGGSWAAEQLRRQREWDRATRHNRSIASGGNDGYGFPGLLVPGVGRHTVIHLERIGSHASWHDAECIRTVVGYAHDCGDLSGLDNSNRFVLSARHRHRGSHSDRKPSTSDRKPGTDDQRCGATDWDSGFDVCAISVDSQRRPRAALAWLETPLLSGGLSLSSDGILSGTPTAAGQFPITLNVTDALGQSASPVPVVVRVSLPHSGSFTVLSASMTAPRSGHTATLLISGKVLIAGGANGVADASAELYDPATGNFTATGSMTEARIGHTATLLNDSARSVLIVGSVDMTAELYNPATGTFTATGSIHHARTSPTATLLSSTGPNAGKVLIVGGNTASGDLVAELYDPGTGAFTDTGSTTLVRWGHTATLLTTSPLAGQVLIAGGSGK